MFTNGAHGKLLFPEHMVIYTNILTWRRIYPLQPMLSAMSQELCFFRFLLLLIFSAAISVSPHVCFILDLILISMFLK